MVLGGAWLGSWRAFPSPSVTAGKELGFADCLRGKGVLGCARPGILHCTWRCWAHGDDEALAGADAHCENKRGYGAGRRTGMQYRNRDERYPNRDDHAPLTGIHAQARDARCARLGDAAPAAADRLRPPTSPAQRAPLAWRGQRRPDRACGTHRRRRERGTANPHAKLARKLARTRTHACTHSHARLQAHMRARALTCTCNHWRRRTCTYAGARQVDSQSPGDSPALRAPAGSAVHICSGSRHRRIRSRRQCPGSGGGGGGGDGRNGCSGADGSGRGRPRGVAHAAAPLR
jgi:hypothetical protein